MSWIPKLVGSVVVSGGFGLAALGVAGVAQADYYWFTWRPGHTPPSAAANRNLDWDWNVCHKYRYNGNDLIDETGRLYPAPPPGAICGTDLFTGRQIPC